MFLYNDNIVQYIHFNYSQDRKKVFENTVTLLTKYSAKIKEKYSSRIGYVFDNINDLNNFWLEFRDTEEYKLTREYEDSEYEKALVERLNKKNTIKPISVIKDLLEDYTGWYPKYTPGNWYLLASMFNLDYFSIEVEELPRVLLTEEETKSSLIYKVSNHYDDEHRALLKLCGYKWLEYKHCDDIDIGAGQGEIAFDMYSPNNKVGMKMSNSSARKFLSVLSDNDTIGFIRHSYSNKIIVLKPTNKFLSLPEVNNIKYGHSIVGDIFPFRDDIFISNPSDEMRSILSMCYGLLLKNQQLNKKKKQDIFDEEFYNSFYAYDINYASDDYKFSTSDIARLLLWREPANKEIVKIRNLFKKGILQNQGYGHKNVTDKEGLKLFLEERKEQIEENKKIYIENQKKRTKDVLIVYPNKIIEFKTLPLIYKQIGDYFKLREEKVIEGHSAGRYKFAFNPESSLDGEERNISLGYNLLFQNIHGPIVFGHDDRSLTEEEVKIIIEENEQLKNFEYEDIRLIKER